MYILSAVASALQVAGAASAILCCEGIVAVERGFEIPICITDTAVVPELGDFKRLGMDCVVNAVWLAL